MSSVRELNLKDRVTVNRGEVGIVTEFAAVPHTGLYQANLIVVPGRPLPPASGYPERLRALSRVLRVLRPGESCVVREASAWTTIKKRITNDDGVARVERAGFARVFGSNTRYIRPA